MTHSRRLAAFVAIPAALCASLAALPDLPLRAGEPAAPADVATLRTALDRAFAAAELDHAAVRAKRFDAKLGEFAPRLAAALSSAGVSAGKVPADAVERTVAALGDRGLPLSAGSVRVAVARMLADPARVADPDEAGVRKAFAEAVSGIFSRDRFEDCWDASFLDLPEVRAWRAAHERAAAPPVSPPVTPAGTPPTSPPTSPPVSPPTEPPVEPPAPPPVAPEPPPPGPAPAPGTDLPSPFADDPAVNLVAVERSKGWVGPWTGDTQEIPERDNRRQRRPAKHVWIDRYEVTCADYLKFLRATDAAKRQALLPAGWTLDAENEPACPAGRERTPVTGVSFLQAEAYAESVGKRLPTEDEWDRAAAGGEKDGREFPWGAGAGGRKWAFGEAADAPTAVDEFPDDRTPDGIVGLAGNVAEMVATQPDRKDVSGKVKPSQAIVIRGGNWRTARPGDCAATFRWFIDAGQGAPHVGFRCVMDESEYRRRFK